ncbi:MAG: UDP-N-acetylmuramoyl-L-alanyl-D-glutamate--2,6-diaminopimelate ligase [Planctomycetota bacterium]|nr:UDP-N-acetylmuramoyl-L-alanyl-D-glutamate--2,6-diaminopimelate ligase [Planctomycetota bacterium]
MRLAELIHNLPVTLRSGSDATPIDGIVEDSRRVGPGDLFIARVGAVADGRRFIGEAIAAGAVAVLTDRAASPDTAGAAHLVCEDVPLCAALLAERFHGEPGRRLALIGITGTNGKTTIAYLAHQLLNRSGVRCGLIGTVQVDYGEGLEPAVLTTPPAVEISRYLARMVRRGCRACVMETSSHALAQQRTAGLRFAGGVFTNLSGDHLDYHGTMEAYAAAKVRLFEAIDPDGWAVINVDDPASRQMIDACRGHITTSSLSDAHAACSARVGALSMSATQAEFAGPWGAFMLRLPLVGRHNVANALQAAAIGHRLGLNGDALLDGLAQCNAPPGRLEPVTGELDPFTVLVDYAHTDDALDNVLRALRPVVPSGGRLRVVFGCGGDRDRSKRPRMAAAAWRWADEVIVTSDNPRTEDPEGIIDDIAAGVPADRVEATVRITDRAEAIGFAIERAAPGDIILIAGKGHEDYQIVGTTRRSFDDRLVAAEALARGRSKVIAT